MITQSLLTYAIGIGTILTFCISLYNSLRKPQETSQTNDAVFNTELKNLTTKLDLIQNNDLHEIKGMFNAHVLNQNTNEREVSDKLARLDTKIEMLMNK